MRRIVAVVLIVCVVMIGVPIPAQADSDDGVITRYDLVATTTQNGTTAVTIDFDIDFGGDDQHGPYVTLPIRQEIQGDPDHYRAFDITDISATSSTGAPTGIDTETDGGALAIKVGDENREVSRNQSYQLKYTIRGLVNPRVDDTDQIFWNVIGTQWEIPLRNVSVKLTGPAAVLPSSTCFAGDPDSRETCESATPDGDSVTFTQPEVPKGQGLTVVGAWPAGTFVGAEPRLIPRRNLGNTFTANPATIGGGVIVAVLGSLLLVLRARRRGRDEQYAGLTPGLTPTGTGGATVQAATTTPVAVQFTPPPGVQPGVMGTLVDATANPRDVTATIVDLAVRGELRIEEVSPDTGKKRKKPDDWRLVRLQPGANAQPLTDWEADLLAGLFPDSVDPDGADPADDEDGSEDSDDRDGADEVLLSEMKGSFSSTMQATQKSLHVEVTERGWFKENPSTVRTRSYLLAAGVLVVGVALTIALAAAFGWGLIGLAVVVIGVVAVITAGRMTARTADGSAVLAQSRGFEQYLKTAEADQIRFEEGVDVFSRYLPYAIVFGVADRWSKVFADLAEQGRYTADPTWYVGPQMYGVSAFAAGGFSDNLDAFSSAATSAMTASSSGSGGGSGFSGSVGGGVGGGGGGSW